MVLRKGRFLQLANAPPASKTVHGAINHVAASFRSHVYPNPSLNEHGSLDWNLSCQLRSYKLADPKEWKQKAIPLNVISLIAQGASTAKQRVVAEVIIGAFFFACQSCEYLQVQNPCMKQTKILTLDNIKFY